MQFRKTFLLPCYPVYPCLQHPRQVSGYQERIHAEEPGEEDMWAMDMWTKKLLLSCFALTGNQCSENCTKMCQRNFGFYLKLLKCKSTYTSVPQKRFKFCVTQPKSQAMDMF